MEDLSNTIPGKFIFFTKKICISKEKVGLTPKIEVFFNESRLSMLEVY